jgi:hypothetical protein
MILSVGAARQLTALPTHDKHWVFGAQWTDSACGVCVCVCVCVSLVEGEHYRSAPYIAFVGAAHRADWHNLLLGGAARHAGWRSVPSITFVGADYHVCGRRVSCLWAQSIPQPCTCPLPSTLAQQQHHKPVRERQQTKHEHPQPSALCSVLFQLPHSVATSQFTSCDLIFSLKFH